MCAFVYGLNDADERVRAASACEIGRQVRKHPCCCTPCVSSALMCALGDCDRKVRRYAERGLRCCGYEVANCCETACNTGCGAGACGVTGPAPIAPMAPNAIPEEGVAPAPAPVPPAPAAEEKETYFSPRIRGQQTTQAPRNSLSNLFGMLK
jgi:hypothetical protein